MAIPVFLPMPPEEGKERASEGGEGKGEQEEEPRYGEEELDLIDGEGSGIGQRSRGGICLLVVA